jgi:hypothetical protein
MVFGALYVTAPPSPLALTECICTAALLVVGNIKKSLAHTIHGQLAAYGSRSVCTNLREGSSRRTTVRGQKSAALQHMELARIVQERLSEASAARIKRNALRGSRNSLHGG